jgi:hypothetical protein
MKRTSMAARFGLLSLLLSVNHPVVAGNELEEIQAAVSRYPESIQSAAATFIVKSEFNVTRPEAASGAPQATHKEQGERIEWAFKGDRFSFKEQDLDPGGKPDPESKRRTVFKDGTQYEFRSPTDDVVHLVKRRSSRAALLDIGYYADAKWIAEDLRSGRFQYSDTTQDQGFGRLYHLTGQTEKGRKREYWIAPERGYLAARIVSAGDAARQQLEAVHECTRMERKGGHWFPVAGSITFRPVVNGVAGRPTARSEFAVNDWSLNQVGDPVFAVKLKPGTRVISTEANTEAVVGEEGKLAVVARFGPSADALALFRLLLVVSIATLLLGLMFKLLRRRVRPQQ